MPKRPQDATTSPDSGLPEHVRAPLPDEPTPLLGNRTPRQFMRRYWQKKPLLIRQAIPDIAAPLARDALFELADLDLQERREGDVLGLNQSGRPISLRFLSLAEHLEVIVDAREVAQTIYATDPDNRGMTVLAGQFTGGDRIDYLDKA